MKNAFLCAAVVVLNCGFALGQQYKVLYSFAGGNDGNDPYFSGVVLDAAGNLYGTTQYGGTGPCNFNGEPPGCGTVFEVSPNQDGTWTETVIYDFQGVASGDGAIPLSGVVLDNAGNLFGTTADGGLDQCGSDSGCGTVFELSPTSTGWAETVIHRFKPGPGGTLPYSGVILDPEGNLYGSTWEGYNSAADVFELKADSGGRWTYDVIGPSPSEIPSNLLIDPSGNLYGLGVNGGYKNGGIIGELKARTDGHWSPQLIHKFRTGADGGYPYGGLTFDSLTGNMYGTTTGNAGGQSAKSTVFELMLSVDGRWKYSLIYTFCCYDYPYGVVTLDPSGNLFGTTWLGGAYGAGAVYELTLSDGEWVENDLYSFTGGADGGGPQAGMVRDSAGNLYGVTRGGGAYGLGVVFEITP